MIWTEDRLEIAGARHDAERLVTRRGLGLALEWGRVKYRGEALRAYEWTAELRARYLESCGPDMRRMLRS